MRLKRLSSIVLAGLLLTGCSSPFDSNGDITYIQFSSERPLIENYLFGVTYADGSSKELVTNRQFTPKGYDGETLATELVRVETDAGLVVTFRMANIEDEGIISEGEFRMQLRKNRSYRFHFINDSLDANPAEICSECTGYFSFEIDTTALDSASTLASDSLYVIWGSSPNNN